MGFSTYKSNVSTQHPGRAASNAALSAGDQILSITSSFQDSAMKVMGAVQANSQARQVVKNDGAAKDGALAVSQGDYDLRGDESEDSRAFNSVVIKGHAAAQENALRVDLADAKDKLSNDPLAYEVYAQEAIKGAVKGSIDPMGAANLKMFGEGIVSRDSIQLGQEVSKKAQDKAKAELITNLDNKRTDVLNKAYNGDNKAMVETAKTYLDDLDDAVEHGEISAVKSAELKMAFGDDVKMNSMKGAFDNALNSGTDKAEELIEVWKNGDVQGFTPEQKNGLLASFESSVRAAKKEESYQVELQNNTVRFEKGNLDPSSKSDKALNNSKFDEIIGGGKVDENTMGNIVNFMTHSKVVPDRVREMFAVSLNSNDPGQLAMTLDLYSLMQSENGRNGLTNQLKPKIKTELDRMSYLIKNGRRLEDIVETKQTYSLEDRAINLKARVDLPDDLGDVIAANSSSLFSKSSFQSIRDTNAYSDAYDDLFRNHISNGVSDEEAKVMADSEISRVWGKTEISGEEKVVMYPIEDTYNLSPNQIESMQADWMRTKQEMDKNFFSDDTTIENIDKDIAKLKNTKGFTRGVNTARIHELNNDKDDYVSGKYILVPNTSTRRGGKSASYDVYYNDGGYHKPLRHENNTQVTYTLEIDNVPEEIERVKTLALTTELERQSSRKTRYESEFRENAFSKIADNTFKAISQWYTGEKK